MNFNKFLFKFETNIQSVNMFKLKPKSKFMLSVGEEGTILLYFQNDTLNKRYFVKNKNSNAIADLKSCLAADKKAPLYLTLNHQEQSYALQSIPGVNRISAYLSIKTKMEHFADNHDINSAFLIEKPSKFDQNWYYLVVLSRAKHLIDYWLNVFIEIGSNFKGILMLPMEMSNIAQKILDKNSNDWKIMVTATKTGGYRQVVMKNNKMVFTRIIPFTDDELPGIIAGGIYQEVQNTIRSLTKFDFKRDDLIDLCIVVQEDIKASLSVINFSESSVSMFTPYELSKLLKLELAISEKDKFCDTIILFHSSKNKPVAIFNTKETKEFYLFNSFYLNSPRFFPFFILTLVIVNVFYLLDFSSNIRVTNDLVIKEQLLSDQLINFSQNYSVKEMDEVYDFINISNILSKIEYSPLAQIKYVEKLKVPHVELKSFEWSYDEIKNSIITKLKFNFQPDKSIFDKYKKLQKRLINNFRTQTVSISNLPATLPTEEQNVGVNVEIEEAI